MFAGKLDPTLFVPGHTITVGGVRHLKIVAGEFLDRNDRTYAGSIFRDGRRSGAERLDALQAAFTAPTAS